MTRVLVIDDSDDFRKLALRWFQSCGIEVEGAADGVQGLALQRVRPADVIVTDIFMPEKEGIETIRDLRREFPGVKIIAVTGYEPLELRRVRGRSPGRRREDVHEAVQVRGSGPPCAS